jgi:hypothetical protein
VVMDWVLGLQAAIVRERGVGALTHTPLTERDVHELTKEIMRRPVK